ncbi:unnamed protein product, partial [Polarella glacialis]
GEENEESWERRALSRSDVGNLSWATFGTSATYLTACSEPDVEQDDCAQRDDLSDGMGNGEGLHGAEVTQCCEASGGWGQYDAMLRAGGEQQEEQQQPQQQQQQQQHQGSSMPSLRAALEKAAAVDRAEVPNVRRTVVFAAGGSAVVGIAGGASGLVAGGSIGSMLGVVPAVFTFGLSVPIGGFLGGLTGLGIGASCGVAIGAVGGGMLGFSNRRLADVFRTPRPLEPLRTRLEPREPN